VSKLTRSLLSEPALRSRRAPVARVLLVFIFSAALGGWLTRAYGSLSVTLPTLVTAALMIQAFREDFARRAPVPPMAAPIPAFEQDALWPDLFAPATRVKSAADDWACDPLHDGSSGDCSSATRIKAGSPVSEPPLAAPAQRSISGTHRLR
jgi:hypothetical protein